MIIQGGSRCPQRDVMQAPEAQLFFVSSLEKSIHLF